MDKNNYLTPEGYALWKYIKDKEIIDAELIQQVFPEMPKNKKNKLLHQFNKKGYLKRARKGLYYNPLKLRSFYEIALRINDGYVGLSSALRYYNLIEYEDFTVFIMTKNFQGNIILKGTEYDVNFIPLKSLFTGFEKKNGLCISTVEKTIFDCFLKPRFVGFNNIAKAIYNARLDWRKFLLFFAKTKNKALCQRAGYVLELLKNETGIKIPAYVFKFLLRYVKSPVKLTPFKGKSAYNRRWQMQDNLGKAAILAWWR